jgi:hypothetical protein
MVTITASARKIAEKVITDLRRLRRTFRKAMRRSELMFSGSPDAALPYGSYCHLSSCARCMRLPLA